MMEQNSMMGMSNPSEALQFCGTCGTALQNDDAFCAGCGSPVIINKAVCSGCGEALTPGDAFCFKCGTPVQAQNDSPISNVSPAFDEYSIETATQYQGYETADILMDEPVNVPFQAYEPSQESMDEPVNVPFQAYEPSQESIDEPINAPFQTYESEQAPEEQAPKEQAPMQESNAQMYIYVERPIAFAEGLPEWSLEPPAVVVRKKSKT